MTTKPEGEGEVLSAVPQRRKEDVDLVARVVNAADVDELRTAVVTLASRVTSLSEALTAVNDIQKRQAENERKTAALQEESAVTKKTAEVLAETSVSKQDAEETARQQLVREKHARKETLFKVYQAVGLILILFLSGVLGLVNYQQSQKSAIYQVCKQRNISNRKVLQVITYHDPSAPPLTATQKANLDLLLSAFSLVDCEKLR